MKCHQICMAIIGKGQRVLCLMICATFSRSQQVIIKIAIIDLFVWWGRGTSVFFENTAFFLSELSPFLELCPFEKIRMKSCQQDILKRF